MEIRYYLSLKSSNKKTGPIPVSTTSFGSCWDGCAFYKNGCYAGNPDKPNTPLTFRWNEVTNGQRGGSFEAFLASVSALPFDQLWRHNQAGDMPGHGAQIDPRKTRRLVKANRGKRGFTYSHKPVLDRQSPYAAANRAIIAAANRDGFTVNLSADNLAHADELAALAIAPVVVVLPLEYGRKESRGEFTESLAEYRARVAALPHETPSGRALSVCPATFLDGWNCKLCKGLCQRQERDSIVGFPAHGSAKAAADVIARGGGAG
jgi:hypothetical protein